MRAALQAGPGRIEVTEVPPPELLPGSVLVAVARCGIATSDVHAWRRGAVAAPAWLGHEWTGRIVAIGPGVSGRFEGERVVGATAPACGACPPCRAGLSRRCERSLALILGTDPLAGPTGGFAETVRADALRLHRVPEGVSDDDAVLAEPAAVAAHAVARSDQRLGDLVVVIGADTTGLLLAELARLAGAARVVVVDHDPGQRELACALGANAALAPGPEIVPALASYGHGLGADVVHVCAEDTEAVATALAAVRPGGTVVLVGTGGESIVLPPDVLLAKEVTVRASLGYDVADVHRALELMADDRVLLEAMWDRVVGFDQLDPALAGLAADGAPGRKVLFAPDR